MNLDTPDQVVARVVAWHNRWPWARRIGPEHVRHIGVLEVARAAPPGDADAAHGALAQLGGRIRGWLAATRPQPGAWRRAWAGLRGRLERDAAPPADGVDSTGTARLPPPTTVARFAARHGVPPDAAPPHWPRRTAGGPPAADVRCLLTAAIDLGAQGKRRVLLGAADGAVAGQRVASRPRSAALGAIATAAVLAAFALSALEGPAPDPQAQAAAPAAPSGPAAVSSAPSQPAPPEAAQAAQAAHADTAIGPNGAAPAVAGMRIQPDLAADYRAALARGDTVAPLRGAAASEPAAGHGGSGAAQAPGAADRLPSAVPAPTAPPRHIAVLAPLADRRADADAMLARMQQVAARLEPAVPALQAEVHATPQGLQPVLWPFATVEAADRMRLALAQAGVRTILLEF